MHPTDDIHAGYGIPVSKAFAITFPLCKGSAQVTQPGNSDVIHTQLATIA